MTTPDGNDKDVKKTPPPPPSQKPATSGIPLAALWPKAEASDQRSAVSQQPTAINEKKPEVAATKPVVAPQPVSTPVPPPAMPPPQPKPVAATPVAPAQAPEKKLEPIAPTTSVAAPKPVVPPPVVTPKPVAASPVAPLQKPAEKIQLSPHLKPAQPVISSLKLAVSDQLSAVSTPKPVAVPPAPSQPAAAPQPPPKPTAKPAKPRPKHKHVPATPVAPPKAPETKREAEAPVPPEVVNPPQPSAQPETISEPAPQAPQAEGRKSMYIVMISSECAPVAKVGGLGDVVFGLSRELEVRGNSVEIILPKYDCMRYDQIYGLQVCFQDLWVPWYNGSVHCTVFFGFVHGRKCFFIEPHSDKNFFNRRTFYGQGDDDQRFAFFSRAALEFMLKSNKHPDVIHCHDWQTGLVPVLLYEMYKFLGMPHPRVCYTLHNVQHQGVTGEHILRATGLNRPEYFIHPDRLQDNFNRSAINLMKAGIVYSNFVTTVSPHYAWEIMNTNQNYGLGATLFIHRVKIGGILNGLDYDTWNPEIDRHIPQTYNPATLEKKYENKKALRNRFWLQDVFKPIVCYVGRLDNQKGVPLITHAIHYAVSHGCQFVLLGTSPDHKISQHFWGLKRQYNDNPDCHLEIGYNEELSHLIYAGSDMIIVPSLFEPCGLTQLIGLKYGTVPIVRAVGGLADTVFDANYSSKPYHERNGYTFNDFNNAGIESALSRAIGLWYNYPQYFRELVLNGMRYDYSWNHSGEHYLNVYDLIRDK